MKENYKAQFRSRPINPFAIRSRARCNGIRADLTALQWDGLGRYYRCCEVFWVLIEREMFPDLYDRMIREMFLSVKYEG